VTSTILVETTLSPSEQYPLPFLEQDLILQTPATVQLPPSTIINTATITSTVSPTASPTSKEPEDSNALLSDTATSQQSRESLTDPSSASSNTNVAGGLGVGGLTGVVLAGFVVLILVVVGVRILFRRRSRRTPQPVQRHATNSYINF
jgi:hypothetical protein